MKRSIVVLSDQALSWFDERVARCTEVLRPIVLSVHFQCTVLVIAIVVVGEGTVFPFCICIGRRRSLFRLYRGHGFFAVLVLGQPAKSGFPLSLSRCRHTVACSVQWMFFMNLSSIMRRRYVGMS